jgi:Protein of Unknown function (DUF2784)
VPPAPRPYRGRVQELSRLLVPLVIPLVIGLHYAFLAYVVSGGFLAWRWPRSIGLHVLLVAWAGVGLLVSLPCPFTSWENALRRRAGEPVLPSGFIDHYVDGVLFPHRYVGVVQVLVASSIAVSWVGFVLRQRSARRERAADHRRRLGSTTRVDEVRRHRLRGSDAAGPPAPAPGG